MLLPEEAVYVAKAVPKRVQEFAAGRLCARRALAEFGITRFAIRAAHDRQPIWPQLLVGSITHTVGFCAAVVGPRARFAGLGVDSEVIGAAQRALWPSICTPAEIAWLESLLPAERAAASTVVFAAKEAFYKLQYPVTGERLSFHDLRITPSAWGSDSGSFAVEATRPIAILGRRAGRSQPAVRGRYRLEQPFALAGIAISA